MGRSGGSRRATVGIRRLIIVDVERLACDLIGDVQSRPLFFPRQRGDEGNRFDRKVAGIA